MDLKYFFVLVILLFSIQVVSATFPLPPSDQVIQDTLAYLADNQSSQGDIGGFATSSWAAMAIESAGGDISTFGSPSLLDYLADNSGLLSSSTDYSRYVLSLTAAEENPYSFNGVNFVALQESFFDGTQFGDASLVNDDIFAILALISAGKENSYEKIVAAKNFVLNNQNSDGGFPFAIGTDSDPDTTAAVIMAFSVSGDSSSQEILVAKDFLKSMQAENAGFMSFGTPNSNTTAWVIMAISSLNESPEDFFWLVDGNSSVNFLLSLQNSDGGFSWIDSFDSDVFSSSYAIISLLGNSFPVNSISEPDGGGDNDSLSVFVRIEAETFTIFEDDVILPDEITFIATNSGEEYTLTEPSVLMALLEASDVEGFDVSINDSFFPGFGFFVDSIDGVSNAGLDGWVFGVDYYSGQVSADNFILDESNFEIVWHYSSLGDKYLRLSFSETDIDEGESIIATVEFFDEPNEQWLPLADANILIVGRTETYITNESGQVTIIPDFSGNFDFVAEKEEFVRSKKVFVSIGSFFPDVPQGSSNVSLTVFIVPAVSIIVDPSLLDFGTVGAGYGIEGPDLTIRNTGSHNISVTAQVSESGNLFTTGLELDNVLWSFFEVLINADPVDFNNPVDVETDLYVPDNVDVSGQQDAILTFWASSIGSP